MTRSFYKVSVYDVWSKKVANHQYAIEESFKDDSVQTMLQNMYQDEFKEPQLSSEMMDLTDPNYGISTDNMRFLQLMK